MHTQLETLQRERKLEITSYDPLMALIIKGALSFDDSL